MSNRNWMKIYGYIFLLFQNWLVLWIPAAWMNVWNSYPHHRYYSAYNFESSTWFSLMILLRNTNTHTHSHRRMRSHQLTEFCHLTSTNTKFWYIITSNARAKHTENCVSSSTLSKSKEREDWIFIISVAIALESDGKQSKICIALTWWKNQRSPDRQSFAHQFYMIEEYSCAMSCTLRTHKIYISRAHSIPHTAHQQRVHGWWICGLCTQLVHSEAEQSFEYASAITIWNLFWTMCHPFLLAWARSALSRLLRRWCCALFCCTVLCCAVYLSTCAVA